MHGALNFYLNRFLELKYYCSFTQNAQYDIKNAHLNIINSIFSNKPRIIAEMENLEFVEIKNK